MSGECIRIPGFEERVLWASSRLRGRDMGAVFLDEEVVAALSGMMRSVLP